MSGRYREREEELLDSGPGVIFPWRDYGRSP